MCSKPACKAKRRLERLDALKKDAPPPPPVLTVGDLLDQVQKWKTECNKAKEEAARLRAEVKRQKKIIADMMEDY